MSSYWKRIINYFERDEYLTVQEASNLGIGRQVLAGYAKGGKLERIAQGVYILPNNLTDEFELLQKKNTKVIYSYGTALYFHGLSVRSPNVVHISVPQGYNVTHIKKSSLNIKVHYVKKEYFELGVEKVRSPQGGTVLVYDKERCLCDIINDRKYVDSQIYQDAIKGYFESKDKDLRKLIKYSKIFKVEKEIRNYIEVLT